MIEKLTTPFCGRHPLARQERRGENLYCPQCNVKEVWYRVESEHPDDPEHDRTIEDDCVQSIASARRIADRVRMRGLISRITRVKTEYELVEVAAPASEEQR